MPYKDPEQQKAYYKRYHAARYQEKKAEIQAKNRQWREANLERTASTVYEWKLKNVYGISRSQFDQILEAQHGVCAICFTDQPGGSGSWHVDHDHETGRVRGLLCMRCNIGLGALGDAAERLWAALEYLDDPPARPFL